MKLFPMITAVVAAFLIVGCKPPIESPPGGNENANVNPSPDNSVPAERR